MIDKRRPLIAEFLAINSFYSTSAKVMGLTYSDPYTFCDCKRVLLEGKILAWQHTIVNLYRRLNSANDVTWDHIAYELAQADKSYQAYTSDRITSIHNITMKEVFDSIHGLLINYCVGEFKHRFRLYGIKDFLCWVIDKIKELIDMTVLELRGINMQCKYRELCTKTPLVYLTTYYTDVFHKIPNYLCSVIDILNDDIDLTKVTWTIDVRYFDNDIMRKNKYPCIHSCSKFVKNVVLKTTTSDGTEELPSNVEVLLKGA